jgi:RimJ/RimL family protein N-acetyltransferase
VEENSRIRIRAFEPTARDDEGVARLNALGAEGEFLDFEPTTAAALRDVDQAFARDGYLLQRYVAEEEGTGAIAGYAYFCHKPWAFDPRAYWVGVRVGPEHRGRGLGRSLYSRVMEDIVQRGGASVQMEAREADPVAQDALLRRGFCEVDRTFEMALDPRSLDLGPLLRAGDRAAASGIVIEALPALRARDPGWLAKLHALHVEVGRAIPLPDEPTPARSPEELKDLIENQPLSLPDAWFIALDGDRYIGECMLQRSEDDPAWLDHLVTGVDHGYQGRGVALALKLRSIQYALERGFTRISTWVEASNPAMVAINERFGFVRQAGLIVFEKRIV